MQLAQVEWPQGRTLGILSLENEWVQYGHYKLIIIMIYIIKSA